MSLDLKFVFIPFGMFLVCMVILSVLILLPDLFPVPETIEGEVTNIQISAGGFMRSDLTTLIFSDGQIITFIGIHNEFRIGMHYKIIYHESGFGGNKIDKIDGGE